MDCWGLCRLILIEQFGKTLPSFNHAEKTKHDLPDFVNECLPLAPVEPVPFDERRTGDIILIKLLGRPCHVGVIVDDNLMLHTLHQHDSALECYTGSKWAHRVEGVYRAR